MNFSSEKSLFSRPFALFIGPQRAGTTWVDRYLRSRGDVCLPEDVKEIFYFDRNFDRGVEFYTSHFQPQDKHQLIMEITATSFDHPDAPERVLDVCGTDIKLICPLRHPVIRSYSLYLHYLRYGIVQGSLQEAVKQEPQILSSSFYAQHIGRWFDIFGKDNITFLFQEELENNQHDFVKKLCAGLNIDFVPPAEEVQGRYNITTFSKFGWIAATSQKCADILRYYKLYAIINFAKSIGLKRIIFGKERPDARKNNMPTEDYQWLMQELGSEIEKLETILGYRINRWEHVSSYIQAK